MVSARSARSATSGSRTDSRASKSPACAAADNASTTRRWRSLSGSGSVAPWFGGGALTVCELDVRVGGSWRMVFDQELDRPALGPLPRERYEFHEWSKARVNIDYHVEFDHHYYSVPYQLNGQEVEIRATLTTVEIFHRGERVASHPRSRQAYQATTVAEHRPKSHQQYLAWPPSRLIGWAQSVGPDTARLFAAILDSKPHPEMGYR